MQLAEREGVSGKRSGLGSGLLPHRHASSRKRAQKGQEVAGEEEDADSHPGWRWST